jgi:hypothetical protein
MEYFMFGLKNFIHYSFYLISSSVLAGTMGNDCHPSSVHIPCTLPAWGFAADALYLQPSTTANSNTYTVVTHSAGDFLSYPNPWAWGLHLEGFYHYGAGSDANINWTHFTPSSTNVLDNAYISGTPVVGAQLKASSDPRWDGVNFELGQLIQLGEHKQMRLHAGFEYARIDNTTAFDITTLLDTAYTTNTSTYNGFGPRLGADLNYLSGYGLTLYAKGATALLAGTTQFNYYAIINTPGGILAVLRDSAVITVVPELEGRLGVIYDYALPQGHLLLDVGWMWVDYFNSENYFTNDIKDILSGDFSVQGVSFGLKWRGNAI